MRDDGPSLGSVQELLYHLLTAPEGVAQGLCTHGLTSSDLAGIIKGNHQHSAVDRLDIYADMYFYRLRDILMGDYPSVVAVTGTTEFHNLVTEYLLDCPPSHPSIRNAGLLLPAFLARHRVSERWPWLGDLARLERQRLEVFDAADAELLTVERLRALGSDQLATLCLRLIPAHVFMNADFPVEEAWQALSEGTEIPKMSASPRQLLVWRGDGTMVYHRRIGDEESAVTRLLREGAPFGMICERLCEGRTLEQATTLAFGLLRQWVTEGLLALRRVHGRSVA